MRKPSRVALTAAALCIGCAAIAAAQQKVEKSPNPAKLELTAEVATTTEEGYPAVPRITVTNVGNVAIDMPMPALECLPHGGYVVIHLSWTPENLDGLTGRGWGQGCGRTHSESLLKRVQTEWIHLRPGEFIVSSENLHKRLGNVDPGNVEYWFEYIPPEATPKELAELRQAGYVVPTERIETPHQTFVVR